MDDHNPSRGRQVVVTKRLPGDRWLQTLIAPGCRAEVGESEIVLDRSQIEAAVGDDCTVAIGQLTEALGLRFSIV